MQTPQLKWFTDVTKVPCSMSIHNPPKWMVHNMLQLAIDLAIEGLN